MDDKVKIKSWCSKLTKVQNEANFNKKEKIELSTLEVKCESQSSHKTLEVKGESQSSHKTLEVKGESQESYKSYSQRWWLLASVALLNVANYAHWICFASVNSKAAVFYQVITKPLAIHIFFILVFYIKVKVI